ncbi:MAG: outer membrane lipoprotein LolB [Burkholderiaceae bacterium]|nr:outer membrane lipoprotein LolB [Burkholderiaceae bacterium]
MTRALGWPALAALGLLLAACATPRAPADAVLSGRLSVRVEGQDDRALAAAFELSGSADAGQLRLSSPLGTTAAWARWSPSQAWLRIGDTETRHADLDALATAALGEPVPIAALFDWLRGRAWAGAPASARSDGVAGFNQLGWQVDLGRWAEGWIEAVRAAPPVITVRAKLESPG